MNYLQNKFLNQFDQPLRKYIVEYCKKFSEEEGDVFILLARKAACFFTVLEELGFLTLKGVIATDRVLQYNTDWLRGKRVVIIDDTIISGTSIYKIIQKLQQIGVADIAVHAFCINEYWYKGDLLECQGKTLLRHPYMKVSHVSSIRFCRQIVNALSIIPRPYCIDFPVYEIGKLSQSHLTSIIEDSNWDIIKTTTLLQEQNQIESFSLNFKNELLDAFLRSLGSDFSKLIFVKLRAFVKELPDDKDVSHIRYSCKIVPFVIFNSVQLSFIDKLVHSICECENRESQQLDQELTTPISKMLFVQYYLAERLIRWWRNYTSVLLSKDLKDSVGRHCLDLLFSPNLVDFITEFRFVGNIMINTENSSLLKDEDDYKPVKGGLTSQFLNLYYEKELLARRIVKKEGRDAFENDLYGRTIDRLEDGVSLNQLKKCIPVEAKYLKNQNLMLSTFLDKAIDKGIIVPITRVKGNTVCRAYRHGEEVIWGDSNDKMLGLFFEHLMFGKNRIPKLVFEKLLVLFLKIGLRLGFLDEYNVDAPSDIQTHIIGIRHYLHGQVTVYYRVNPYEELNCNPILDPDTGSYWTTRRLQNLSLLEDTDECGYVMHFDKLQAAVYSVKKEQGEVSDIDPDIEAKVLNFAEILQICLSEKWLDSEGLVKITSCINPIENTSSIGAELSIFCNQYAQYKNQIEGALRFGSLSLDLLKTLRRPPLASSDTPSNTIFLWTAIHSGKEKYFNFREGKGRKLIIEISEKLSKKNTIARRLWDDYWRKDIELINACEPELDSLNETMGIIAVDIKIALACQHIILFELLSRDHQIMDYKASRLMEVQSIDKDIQEISKVSPNEGERIQTLYKSKSRIQREIYKTLNFQSNNIKSIQADVSRLTPRQADRLKSLAVFEKINNGQIGNYMQEQLFVICDRCSQLLEDLERDSKDALKDFESLIPQWGKIKKSLRYNSLMHINVSTNDARTRDMVGKIVKSVLQEFEVEEYGDSRYDKSIVILRIEDVKLRSGYLLAAKGQRHDERLIKLGCKILQKCKSFHQNVNISIFPEFSEEGIRATFNKQTKCYDRVKENLFQKIPENTENEGILVLRPPKNRTEAFYNLTLKRYNLYDCFMVKSCNLIKNSYIIKMEKRKKKIFISYSRKDVGFKDALKAYLSHLTQLDIADAWSCDQIHPGQWHPQIQKQLEESDIVIYMLSASFLGSPYIMEQEVERILSGRQRKGIICVLVSAIPSLDKIHDYIASHFTSISDYQRALTEIKNFQFLPYGRIRNEVTHQEEELLIPLKDYNKSIEVAFQQIETKILEIIE